ncbi:MAG: protein kinase, partial [Planctomycetota bacterium]|nr:protein kinase [Planctomycetota bacterium]
MSADEIPPEGLGGKVMGGCKLIRRLGNGAMGVVYLAEQLELKRQVALKILDPKFSADKSYIERFEMEAKAAAKLNHPNIVKVYDIGREDNAYFIINEYIDGGSVQKLIEERGALQPEDALEYAIQAAKGLAAAAKADIVHR